MRRYVFAAMMLFDAAHMSAHCTRRAAAVIRRCFDDFAARYIAADTLRCRYAALILLPPRCHCRFRCQMLTLLKDADY